MSEYGRTVVTRAMHAAIKAARHWFTIEECAELFTCSTQTITRYQKLPLDREPQEKESPNG